MLLVALLLVSSYSEIAALFPIGEATEEWLLIAAAAATAAADWKKNIKKA